MQNEFQAAYEVSQIRQRERNVLDIPEGMFAVVTMVRAYCEFTDAALPNPNRYFLKAFGSRRIADHVAKRLNEKTAHEEEYPEHWYEVFPKLPAPPAPSRIYVDDEIPF